MLPMNDVPCEARRFQSMLVPGATDSNTVTQMWYKMYEIFFHDSSIIKYLDEKYAIDY